ncbi:MAG: monovalent cation/H+ antiporter complex subunit F [Jannaschia sp.]
MNEAVTTPLVDSMPILAWSVQAGFVMVMAGIVLAFIRLAKGPSLPDRVVALDTMTVLIVAFCGLFVFESGSSAFLDVAVVLALIGFLATVALARFVERKTDRAPAEKLRSAEDIPGDPS